jgi:hypothetical protein
MLDPAGLRKNLVELTLRDGTDGALFVEQKSAGTGCALIESEDVWQVSLLHFAWRLKPL